MKLLDPDYLSHGTERQKKAYALLKNLGVFTKLAQYGPVLTGAVPIDVDFEESSLELVLAVENLQALDEELSNLFGKESEFQLEHRLVRNIPTALARFKVAASAVEIFAQNRSVLSQPAVLKMLVEARLLAFAPSGVKTEIRELKKNGLSTEAAFAKCFEIHGDPDEELLKIAQTTDREILQIAHQFLFKC